jgi:hypothetical protein
MASVVTWKDGVAAKRLNLTGAALFAVAVALPFVAFALGSGSREEAIAGTTRSIASALLPGAIAWFVTRKKSALSKARGNAIVAALVLITAASALYSEVTERTAESKISGEVVRFYDQNQGKLAEFGKRFDQIDFSAVLTPQGLTTPKGINDAKRTLAAFQALLAERKALIQGHRVEVERFFGSLPSGRVARQALESARKSLAADEALYARLDTSQSEFSDALASIIGWAEGRLGSMSVKDGQLQFATVALQQEFQQLLGRLVKAEESVGAVAAAMTDAQQRADKQRETVRALVK